MCECALACTSAKQRITGVLTLDVCMPGGQLQGALAALPARCLPVSAACGAFAPAFAGMSALAASDPGLSPPAHSTARQLGWAAGSALAGGLGWLGLPLSCRGSCSGAGRQPGECVLFLKVGQPQNEFTAA